MTRTTLMAAAIDSATDSIGSGWCGRGMLSILKNAGFGKGLAGGNGQDWEMILSKAGWKAVRCSSPLRAPLGSVLVYLGDSRVGKRPRNPRVAPGGTVPDNFTGRAWIPPGRALWKTPPPGEDIQTILEERKALAMKYFRRNGQELATLSPAIGK